VRDDPSIVSNYGALAIAHHHALAAATTAAGVLVLVALWTGFARGAATPDRFARFAAACVCCFIAFGKVLSPQYLIWLVPLVPLVRGRRGAVASLLLAFAFLATDVFFYSGRRFGDYAFGSQLAWLVLARDLLLVAIVAILVIPVTRRPLTSG
jgi:hypothetical protein